MILPKRVNATMCVEIMATVVQTTFHNALVLVDVTPTQTVVNHASAIPTVKTTTTAVRITLAPAPPQDVCIIVVL